MLTNFFYTHPVWVVGLVVIGVWTGLSLLGLFIFNKISDSEKRHKDTETVGLTYAIVAVVYAVLIGFIVVNVFESSSKGDEIATTEANKMANLKSDSVGLSMEESVQLRYAADKYLDIVIKKEWPAQERGDLAESVFEPGWEQIGEMSTMVAEYEPTTQGQTVTKAEMLHVMGDLVQARRNRIEAAGEHVPDVIWQILLLAGAVAVGYTYLFGAHSFKIHMAITGLIAATISLVFVLIIALDYPFRGEVAVGDDAFVSVRTTRTVEPGSDRAKLEAAYRASHGMVAPTVSAPETSK